MARFPPEVLELSVGRGGVAEVFVELCGEEIWSARVLSPAGEVLAELSCPPAEVVASLVAVLGDGTT